MDKGQAFNRARFPHLHQGSRNQLNTAMAQNSFLKCSFPTISRQDQKMLKQKKNNNIDSS